jgi:hypothetical protein
MCFLKTLKPLDDIRIEKEQSSHEASSEENCEESRESLSYLNDMLTTKTPVLNTKQDQRLFDILALAKANTLQMQNF